MNQTYGKKYDIDQFLEIFDTDLISIYQNHYWGYKYNYYISAMQNCHPNYVQFLLDKKTLSVSSINNILSNIPDDIKLLYNQNYIEKAYMEYQSNSIEDNMSIKYLSLEFENKNVVLLGPGLSLRLEEEKINNFLMAENPIIISVNFEPDFFECAYVFVSNSKRYSKLSDSIKEKSSAKLITTSNISAYDRISDYTLNYLGLMALNEVNSDNALLLAVAMLVKCGVKKVNLVGFDGFKDGMNDYYDLKYAFAGNVTYNINSNHVTKKGLKTLSKYINLRFLTKSIYEGIND